MMQLAVQARSVSHSVSWQIAMGGFRAGGAALPRVEGEPQHALERARLARVALAQERQPHLPSQTPRRRGKAVRGQGIRFVCECVC